MFIFHPARLDGNHSDVRERGVPTSRHDRAHQGRRVLIKVIYGALRTRINAIVLPIVALGLAACGAPQSSAPVQPEIVPGYGTVLDGGHEITPVPASYVPPENRVARVDYPGNDRPGTIVIDTDNKYLYLVEEGGTAMRYRVAVGDEGRALRGTTYVGRKAEWPYWAPTANMIRTQPELYAGLAGGMPPGVNNPLGARALYLYRGGRDTMFRIHGTGDYTSIGNATSAGCIRLYNQDIIDLYNRVPTSSTVKVLHGGLPGGAVAPPPVAASAPVAASTAPAMSGQVSTPFIGPGT
jgi:lipoprotein-anchoring transpeptidase ErfK/SrfK